MAPHCYRSFEDFEPGRDKPKLAVASGQYRSSHTCWPLTDVTERLASVVGSLRADIPQPIGIGACPGLVNDWSVTYLCYTLYAISPIDTYMMIMRKLRILSNSSIRARDEARSKRSAVWGSLLRAKLRRLGTSGTAFANGIKSWKIHISSIILCCLMLLTALSDVVTLQEDL
ncbi:hypothetical protein VTL71DRAFT_13203 [Oculimacula yallundae]|uniref:Uncharacterized protein n=1 Tax=Oculimacula yallundae TaxID=86028 RepID=A0ABR4CJN8_9HELO